MRTLSLVLIFSFAYNLCAQNPTERYSTVGITIKDYEHLIEEHSQGLAIDHFHKNEDGLLEFIFSESELELLTSKGISYEVIIDDYKYHFQSLANKTVQNKSNDCGLINFDEGNMGGYHTYDQIVEHIRSMESQFSDYVDVMVIGYSIENRPIYAVKISDNPQIDESDGEGVVYFESLTHAREPMSLEVTLHYMWWLLENQENDEEVNYLIDHREIYFVPIVNPDGYVYNESTDPNGGGFWRKNRRITNTGCDGVDINRNYPKSWGLNSGSSHDPCSEVYRGENPLSEPETAAIVGFLNNIKPSIAFSSHSAGDRFLSPWGYVDSLQNYELYAEFVSEFIPANYNGYGTVQNMFGYTASGTTTDYFHSEGVLTWTPEIGHTFWDPPTVICDRANEFRKAMKYLTWVSGDHTCFHDFTVQNKSILMGDTLAIDIRLKNRGLSMSASDVSVILEPQHSSINAISEQANFGAVANREYAESLDGTFKFDVVAEVDPGEQIPFLVKVYQDSVLSYSKTIYVTAGEKKILYQTDFEQENEWQNTNSDWDTCFMDAKSGFHSFADSRYGNYLPNSKSLVVLGQAVDLSEANIPYVSFNAKWSLEPDFDFVSFLASTNGIDNWVNLSGLHTDKNNKFTQNSHWVQERFDLADFVGEREVYFAFRLESDGNVQSDGFYIDDFKVVDFESSDSESNDDDFTDLSIVPNPSNGQTEIRFHSKISQTASIEIYDSNGAMVFKNSQALLAGSNSIPINLETAPSGVYIVQLIGPSGNIQIKMVKV